MAQLPPKFPPVAQNWPSSVPFQIMPLPVSTQQQNSWVDEFLDFSAVRRCSHRRSASDSIAFVEAPFVEECSNSNPTSNTCNNDHGFEGLDDEQLRNMFSDAVAATVPSTLSSSNPSRTNPSTPSDQNSENNDEKNKTAQEPYDLQPKNEAGEVDISSRLEAQTQTQSPSNNPFSNIMSPDAIVDPKRIKRILANRQSAQRSRVRKLQYISELERSVTTLQTEVSVLSPKVAFFDHQRLILNVDNSVLKQRIAALAQDKIFKDAHQEALRKEVERLRRVYHEQNVKTMGESGTTHEVSPPAPPQPNFNKSGCTDP